MDAKRALLMAIVSVLIGANYCSAGDTVLTGTATCYMPEMIEMRTTTISASDMPAVQPPKDSVAPAASGASGNYLIQKEERMMQTEKAVVLQDSPNGEEITIYSVCAK